MKPRLSTIMIGVLTSAVVLFLAPSASAAVAVTTRVNVSTSGTQGAGESNGSSISVDGRYVAFTSGATNLVAGDTNGRRDIFLHDRQPGTTE
jgi:Tol biopolymer transport system component